jgi:hypothetical protein
MLQRFAIALVCLLLLSLAPLALAQDLDEAITQDGFTYLYPTGWVSQVDSNAIIIVPDEAMFDPNFTAEGVPADLLRVVIDSRVFVKFAPAEMRSAKTTVIIARAMMQLDGEFSMGSFDNVDYMRFEAHDPSTDSLLVMYGLDFGNALTLVMVSMGSDYDEEPPVILDMLTSIVYEPPPLPAISEDDTIAYGDEFVGELTEEGEAQALVFEGSAGDLVTINMNSEAFDTELRLYSEASGEPLILNDGIYSGTQPGMNARISYFQLPEDGSYVIVATTRYGDIGEYTLTLQEGVIPLESAAMFVNISPDIAYGDTVTGDLGTSRDEQMAYVFEGSAGDVVTITVTAENEDELDPLLELYAARAYDYSDGIPIAFNDDLRDSTNSQITDFILPEDGIYIIIARRLYGYGDGEYTLTLEEGGR